MKITYRRPIAKRYEGGNIKAMLALPIRRMLGRRLLIQRRSSGHVGGFAVEMTMAQGTQLIKICRTPLLVQLTFNSVLQAFRLL